MVVVYAVTGGTVSLVQGSYEYFHYLHEGYNDSVIAILLLSNDCYMFIIYMSSLSCAQLKFHIYVDTDKPYLLLLTGLILSD